MKLDARNITVYIILSLILNDDLLFFVAANTPFAAEGRSIDEIIEQNGLSMLLTLDCCENWFTGEYI